MDERPVDLKKLTEPFPREALMTRQVQGKPLSYVQGHTVINRLNAATGNHWDFEILMVESREVRNDRANRTDLLMTARVRLTLPGLGSREHVGVQMVAPGSGEDLVKGAVTDALKKAATLFGVGLELYGPDYEDAEPVDRATGEIHAKTTAAPSRSAEPPAHDSRADAAATLWQIAKTKGVSRDVLDQYAVEKVKKALDQCDTKDLLKLVNGLKQETDIAGMIDFFTNRPPAEQGALLPAGDRTPANFR